eukprot:jgi/Chrzof1/8252/Cz03g03070.t1
MQMLKPCGSILATRVPGIKRSYVPGYGCQPFSKAQVNLRQCAARRQQSSSMTAAASQTQAGGTQNVLGGPLECCCTSPKTGFYRDGYCQTGPQDHGVHVVCAQVTAEFLDFTRAQGNDLSTPHPPSFPGLKPGDRWCLCASRWKEAADAGVAPPVVLAATHAKALDHVSLDLLKDHAVDGSAVQQ